MTHAAKLEMSAKAAKVRSWLRSSPRVCSSGYIGVRMEISSYRTVGHGAFSGT